MFPSPVILDALITLIDAYYAGIPEHYLSINGSAIKTYTIDDVVYIDTTDYQPHSLVTINLVIQGGNRKKKSIRTTDRPMVQPTVLKGHGDYKTAVANVLKQVKNAIASEKGKQISDKIGSQMGKVAAKYTGLDESMMSTMGRKLTKFIRSKITGSGDYSTNGSDIRVNSIFKTAANTSSSFRSQDAVLSFCLREYIGEVLAGTGFVVVSYPVDPSSYVSYTILPLTSQLYDEFCLRGKAVEFVTNVSPYSVTPNMGQVIIAYTDDPLAPIPLTKVVLENTFDAISERPDHSIIYGIECSVWKDKWLLVNKQSLGANTSLTTNPVATTTAGQIFVGVNNTGAYAAGTSLGELWFTYEYWFRGPIVPICRPGYLHYQLYWNSVSVATPASSVFRTNVSYGKGTSITYTLNTGVISFTNADPGDNFCVMILFTGTATITGSWSLLTLANCAVNNCCSNYTLPGASVNQGTTSSVIQYITIGSNSTASTATITFPTFGAANSCSADIIVFPFASALVTGSVVSPSL